MIGAVHGQFAPCVEGNPRCGGGRTGPQKGHSRVTFTVQAGHASSRWIRATRQIFLVAAAVWLLGVALAAVAAAQSGVRQVDIRILDQQGLPIDGAQVTLVAKQSNATRTAGSVAGTVRIDGLASDVYELQVRAAGFTMQTMTLDLRTESVSALEVRLEPAGIAEQLVVTATRSERPMNDIPASVSIVTREEIAASPAVVADDVLRQVPTFSLFRRTSSLVAQPTTQGVSLRGIGPSGQSRTLVLLDGDPVQRSVRRLGVLDARAARQRRSHRGHRGHGVEPVRQLRDGRRHQHRHQPADAADDRVQAAVRQSRAARSSTSSRATRGARSASLSKAASSTPTVFRSSHRASAARSTTTPTSTTATSACKLEYTPTDRLSAFFRAGYFSEERVNGKIGEVNDTRWTTGNGGVRCPGCRTTANLQARVFVDRQKRALQLPRRDQRGDDAQTSCDWRPISTCRPTASAAWCSGRRRSARTHAFSAGDRLALGRRRQPGGCVRRRCADGDRSAGVTQPAALSVQARLGRHAAEPGRLRAGHLHADIEAGRHAQRARRSLAELRRAQPGNDRRDRAADGEQQAVACRTRPTRSSARAWRRSTT